MKRIFLHVSQKQTAFSSWIIGIVFQHFPIHDSSFDVRDIKIVFKPFLLSMKAEFVALFDDALFNIIDCHSRGTTPFRTPVRVPPSYVLSLGGILMGDDYGKRHANGAEAGTRTRMGCPTRPSNVRVYQFHHFGMTGL